MNYCDYSAEDFALDKNFQQWVLSNYRDNNDFWVSWISENPEKNQFIIEAKELVLYAGLSARYESNKDYLRTWHHLKDNIKKEELNRKKPLISPVLKYAAVFIMVFSSMMVWFYYQNNEYIEYHAAYGEIREFLLPDGSKITLNSNSKVRLKEHWKNKEDRLVFLTGEAFFEVNRTPDSTKFIVETNDELEVQVLGTQFNVNTRADGTAVFLKSGKVRLKTNINSTTREINLTPGDLAVYKAENKSIQTSHHESENLLAWKGNMFIFDNASLATVAREITNFSGIKVVFEETGLREKRITASLSRTNIDLILEVVAEAAGVEVEKNDDLIIIKPK